MYKCIMYVYYVMHVKLSYVYVSIQSPWFGLCLYLFIIIFFLIRTLMYLYYLIPIGITASNS